MSKRFNLGDNTWQAFERDDRLPKTEVLQALADLGFSLDWLATGIGVMRPDAGLREDPAHEPQDRPAGLIDRVFHGKRGEGRPVPGWSQEFADRLDAVVAQVGGPAIAAQMAGVNKATLFAWRDGEIQPTITGLAILCHNASMSLDWLARGEGKQHLPPENTALPPESDVDRELLRKTIVGVAEYVKKRRAILTPTEQAAIFIAVYDELRETGAPSDPKSIALTLRAIEQMR